MEAAPLIIENLSKIENRKGILESINLAVAESSSCGVLIRNDLTRSIFLRIILGTTFPTNGKVYLWGKDIHKSLPHYRKSLSFLGKLQDYFFFHNIKTDNLIKYHKSFYKDWNLLYEKKYRELLKIPKSIRIKISDKYLIAKLQILLEICKSSKLFIIEEIHSDIDKEIKDELFKDLKKMGASIFIVTDDPAELDRIEDRVGAIKDKNLVFWENIPHLKKEHKKIKIFSKEDKDIASLNIGGIIRVENEGKIKILTVDRNYNLIVEMLKLEGFHILYKGEFMVNDLIVSRGV